MNKNPDVEELIRYNREGCKHEATTTEHRWVPYSPSGGRLIGMHNVSRWITTCNECHTELEVSAFDPAKLKELEELLKGARQTSFDFPPTCVIDVSK